LQREWRATGDRAIEANERVVERALVLARDELFAREYVVARNGGEVAARATLIEVEDEGHVVAEGGVEAVTGRRDEIGRDQIRRAETEDRLVRETFIGAESVSFAECRHGRGDRRIGGGGVQEVAVDYDRGCLRPLQDARIGCVADLLPIIVAVIVAFAEWTEWRRGLVDGRRGARGETDC